MSDEKMVTEREVIARLRLAFCNGTFWQSGQYLEGRGFSTGRAEKEACWRYKLPAVTQPRVVVDPHIFGVEWHVVNDRVLENRRVVSGVPYPWFCFDHGGGIADHWRPTPRRIALWADLLANPTEEVDGE